MQKQFEYKPFDRVTVEIDCEIKHADTQLKEFIKRLFPAVLSGISFIDDSFVSGAYIRTDRSFTTFTCDVGHIKPGHYDEFGDWLPQPGEPCYYISSDGKAVQTMVFSADSDFVTTVSAIGLWRDYYKVFGGKAIGTPFWYCEDINQDIPQSAILYPGRIKKAAFRKF